MSTFLQTSNNQVFWDTAREFQQKIETALKKTNLFNMLISNEIEATLIDSLYFNIYGLVDSTLSRKFLAKMKWDNVNYG